MDELRFLGELERLIQSRIETSQSGSYTARLAAEGPLRIAQKLGEEAVETALAAVAQDRDRVCEEAADLVYHLLVLLAVRGVPLTDVITRLEARHRTRSESTTT